MPERNLRRVLRALRSNAASLVEARVRAAGVSTSATAALLVVIGFGLTESRGADLNKGEALFTRQCALCHTIGQGESNRFGPNLFGILGRKAGTVAGFKYSQPFQSTASWDWNAETLKAWILGPSHMVPGTTMGVFQGVADRDSDDLIAYLASHK